MMCRHERTVKATANPERAEELVEKVASLNTPSASFHWIKTSDAFRSRRRRGLSHRGPTRPEGFPMRI